MSISYQVLARKWRPHTLNELVGQEHVIRMLTNALDLKRLHHAYLFTGTRGVGKTTIARIFAKCLNCETGVTSKPCDQCNTCQAIDNGKFLDLIEIDAASRTKVEDTRELLEHVQYTPVQGRYKVYLIDEVHMLSGHSFNALLKTLEEPPSYVVFLLATTDPKRLPITVLSRCLQFQLKRVPADKIAQHLMHICTTEQISFEAPALQLLANAADGSLRDALSLLDQTIAYCREQITVQATQDMLGTVERHIIYPLLDALQQQDGKQLIDAIHQLAEQAPEFHRALEEVLTVLHQISVTQLIADAPSTDDYIKRFATAFSAEDIQLFYQIALIGRRDLPLAPTPQQGFEMVMLRMLAFRPAGIAEATPIAKKATVTPTPAPKSQPKTQASPAKTTAPKPVHVAAPANVANAESSTWTEILPQLGLTGMAQAIASNCTLTSLTDNTIHLALTAKHEPMLNKKLSERIEQAMTAYFKKPIHLTIEVTTADLPTPAKQHQHEKEVQQHQATEAIQNDAGVKKIMDMFDAKLDVGSIKAID